MIFNLIVDDELRQRLQTVSDTEEVIPNDCSVYTVVRLRGHSQPVALVEID